MVHLSKWSDGVIRTRITLIIKVFLIGATVYSLVAVRTQSFALPDLMKTHELQDKLSSSQTSDEVAAATESTKNNVFRTRSVSQQLRVHVDTTANTNITMQGVVDNMPLRDCAFCGNGANANVEIEINRTALWQHEWAPFLSRHMLRRSRKFVGHLYRFQRFLQKLHRGEPTRILLFGGSNCQAAYVQDRNNHFAQAFPAWLNRAFPPTSGRHTLLNLGIGGAGACPANTLLHTQLDQNGRFNEPADLALLEFSINDSSFWGGNVKPFHASVTSSDSHDDTRICFEALVRQLLDSSACDRKTSRVSRPPGI
jgi:hypothetical protein